jgi:LAO/AO transport system kinase
MTHPLPDALAHLLERFSRGERAALARAISIVEGQRPGYDALLHQALQGGPRARRVGLTGPPGAGKSSLVAQLAQAIRARDETVGVIAVDPTSPYSGGALLGDRIRMNDLATDPGIFIRSMATRGSLGGLAITTREVVDLMDAYGFPRLLIETVGVGQTELEITGAADTVVVVLVPESGDSIQAMKAGLMEIADIFVVNKSDRPGADRLVKDLRLAIHLRMGQALKDIPGHHGVDLSKVGSAAEAPQTDVATSHWEVPVLKTVAHNGQGLDELIETISQHELYLRESGELEVRRQARARRRIEDVVERTVSRRVWAGDEARRLVEEGSVRVAAGEETPYSVADQVVRSIFQ